MVSGLAGELPFVDEHSVGVDAGVADAYARLDRRVRSSWVRTHRRPVERVLGTEFPGGFRIATTDPPRAMVLDGSHRFSRYRLEFGLTPEGEGTRLSARTFASFPGLHGGVYELFVIRSGLHVRAVRRMLRQIAAA